MPVAAMVVVWAVPTHATEALGPAELVPSFAAAIELLRSDGPIQSRARAVPILEAVAHRGDARAQVTLGAVLLEGKLVTQDKITGYAWLQIGSVSGDGPYDASTQSKAAELMRQVEPSMSGSDLIKADQFSQQFLAARKRRIDDGFAQAAAFYVGEPPTDPDSVAFARDPVNVLPGLAPAPGDSFRLGCAGQPTLRECRGTGELQSLERCTGILPRAAKPPLDPKDRNLRRPAPEYPSEMRRAAIEGDVRLLAHVDRSGWICSVRLAVSSGVEMLDEAALQGVRSWRVSPETRDGTPVESLQKLGVSFGLIEYEFAQ
jgi:TonB family protein